MENIIYQNRHSYYPVCQETKENIIGILDTKAYFCLDERTRENILTKAVKPAYFIPESMKAAKLFDHMKQSRNYFAVLLDEYGEMSGIATLHDLIEELVGDIYEENEENPEKYSRFLQIHGWSGAMWKWMMWLIPFTLLFQRATMTPLMVLSTVLLTVFRRTAASLPVKATA